MFVGDNNRRETPPKSNMVRVVQCPVPGCEDGEPDGDGHPTPFTMDPDCKSVSERTTELAEHRASAHTLTVNRIKADVARLRLRPQKSGQRPRGLEILREHS